jgi:hypothetical protein
MYIISAWIRLRPFSYSNISQQCHGSVTAVSRECHGRLFKLGRLLKVFKFFT